MAIIEMIPPEYWRQLKRELDSLNLHKISNAALPDGHPEGRSTALQYEEARDSIFGEVFKEKINALVQKRTIEIQSKFEEERSLRQAMESEINRLTFILDTRFGYRVKKSMKKTKPPKPMA